MLKLLVCWRFIAWVFSLTDHVPPLNNSSDWRKSNTQMYNNNKAKEANTEACSLVVHCYEAQPRICTEVNILDKIKEKKRFSDEQKTVTQFG